MSSSRAKGGLRTLGGLKLKVFSCLPTATFVLPKGVRFRGAYFGSR